MQTDRTPSTQTAFLAKSLRLEGEICIEDLTLSKTSSQRQGKQAIKSSAERIVE